MTNSQIFFMSMNILSIIVWISVLTKNSIMTALKRERGEKVDMFTVFYWEFFVPLLFMFSSIFVIMKIIFQEVI